MDLEIIILSEVNQGEKDKYHKIPLHVEPKKMIQMNLDINSHRLHKHIWLPKGKYGMRDKLGVWD